MKTSRNLAEWGRGGGKLWEQPGCGWVTLVGTGGRRPTDRPTNRCGGCGCSGAGGGCPEPGSVPWVGAVGRCRGQPRRAQPRPRSGVWVSLGEALGAAGFWVRGAAYTRGWSSRAPCVDYFYFYFFFFSSWENVGSKKNFRRK